VTRITDGGARHLVPPLCAALALVACTGGSPAALSAPTKPTALEAIALAPDAQRYAAIVAPVDAAIRTFESESGALRASAGVGDFVAIASPFANTMAAVDRQLRQGKWPAVALPGIRAELAAGDSLQTDLTGTLDVSLILSVWRHEIVSDAARISRAKANVSIALGYVAPASS
jgi:hypothetical protein